MKKRNLFLFAVASFLMLALPTKAQTDDSVAAQEAVGKKTLPYPRATRAIPATAMEYDSIAGCFVVRDTIAPSRVGSRSGAARTVVTRAAVAYTEDGVQYGYFGDQLSSDNMAEMRQIVESWTTLIPNIDIDEVLSPAPDKETWYMQIVGVDNDDLDDADGEMRIYNDIGTTYNYKTIAIDSTGLRGNTHIKKVVFDFPNPDKVAPVDASAGMLEKLVLLSTLTAATNAAKGTLNLLSDKEKVIELKRSQEDIAHLVEMCAHNGYDIAVHFKHYGVYRFGRSVKALDTIKRDVIQEFRCGQMMMGKAQEGEFLLIAQLDKIRTRTENYVDEEPVEKKRTRGGKK